MIRRFFKILFFAITSHCSYLTYHRMKRFAAFYVLVSSIFSFSQAQHPILYGTSTSGNGGIFRYTEQDNELRNVYRFKNSGIFSESQMVVGNDGIIYGVAEGGPYGDGIIYSLNPVTNQYTIRKNFHFPNGDRPNSPLVHGKDGKFYGPTLELLYSFDPATSEYNEIFHFTEHEIYNARALTIASDGLLYGIVTPFNGDDPDFLFSFDLVNNKFQNLGVSGFSYFSSSLIEGTAGTLYGLTASYLYSYSLSSKQFTKLFQFNSRIEGNRSLTLGSDGKLYSTSTYGGATNHGTIFCFDPKRNSMKVIHDFDGQKGEYSRSGLVEGEDGKLYGMCLKTVPSPFNAEVVGSIYFSIDKDGNNYKIFRDFDHTGRFGEIGGGNFVLANHKIYGTAVAERTNPFEYIFSYSGSLDLFQQVIRTNQEKGFNPSGSMVQARDGRLYGVTNGGGSYGLGGIFSFNPGSGLYTMLFSFNKERGYNTIDDRNNYIPKNELVEAGNGKLYGVTSAGGPGNNGVIFSYDPNNSRYVVEKSFKPGSRPSTGFTVATDGNLYSTLEIEKSEVEFEYQIFAFNPITRNYKVITRRSGNAYFTQLSDGKMYASVGGGVEIFDPATNKVEYSFPESDQPEFYSQNLIEAADHKLYGITTSTGSDLSGMIFSFDPSDRTFEDLFYFDGTNGFWPVCVLLAASDGKLYGTASKGGNDNLGTLFSFDPMTKSFQLLQHFDVRTGGNPGGQGNSAFQSYGASRLVELNTSTPSIVSITDKSYMKAKLQNSQSALTA